MMERLTLTPDTIGPLRRGHPWVYTSGLADPADLPPPGTPVQLMDTKGKPVAFGLADDGPIAVRVLDRHSDNIGPLIQRRIADAHAIRPSLLPADTNAYRVVHGAGDGLGGLVIDRYAHTAVLRLYGACWEPHLDELVRAITAIEGIQSVMRRFGVRRVDGREGAETLHGPDPGEPIVVREAGLQFLARPVTGQKTGLFLDQREHRIRMAAHCEGQHVVNLFAYNGGFSVHAAAAGAKRVISVDIAEAALEDAKENFRLNGLDPDAHQFIGADVFQWNPDQPADVVICDPPSLTHGKTADTAARKAYRDLAQRTGTMVRPGGLLATASCSARLNWERWEHAVRDGLDKSGRWSWLWRGAEPPDHPVAMGHPEGRYLKFAVLRRWASRFG
jgi:23S rRNA (cytosine1962-C5)-methyltransferase